MIDLDWRTINALKLLLCLAAIPGVAFLWRRNRPRAAWVFVVVGILAFFNFGAFHIGVFPHSIHYYDIYHYYFGGKYFTELGYFDLYAATVAADQDGDRFFDGVEDFEVVRDLRADVVVPWRNVLAEAPRIRDRFSDDRWAEFQAELRFFQANMPPQNWQEALTDYGFNAPPVWVLTGGLAAHLLSGASLPQLFALAWLDVVLLGLAFWLVKRAFGLRVMAVAVLFFGLNYTGRYQHVSGSLLRYDWLALLMAGLSLVRLGRPVPAGICLGWATMLRFFPGLFVAALALHGVVEIYRGGRVFGQQIRISAVAVGTALVLVCASFLLPAGPGAWVEYSENIANHNKRVSEVRIALPYVFMFTGEWTRDIEGEQRGTTPTWEWRYEKFVKALPAIWAARLIYLSAFVLVCLRCRSWQALALGLVLVWAFANPGRYYWCMLVLVIPLLFDPPPARPRLAIAMTLFGLMASSYAIYHFTWHYPLHQFHMSLVLGVIFAWLLAVIRREGQSRRRQTESPPAP